MDDLSRVLQEGMRGLLLTQVRRGSLSPAVPHEGVRSRASPAGSAEDQPFMLGSMVMVGGMHILVDGRWRLRRAASWVDGRLQVYASLWPTPPWNLHRRLVRFTCHNKPTVFTMRPGAGLGSAQGYLAELMEEMGRRLNFTSSLIPTEGFGSLTRSGSWNGMVGVIASGEADVAPLDFTPSVERLEVVDFSRPLGQDVVVILAQAPAVLVRPFLLLQIYSPQMWGCVLGGAMLVGLVMARLAVLEAEMDGRPYRRNISQHLISSLSILVYQSSTKWPTGMAGRLLACLMMVVSLVVGSLYCGSITAFLAIPFRSEPVNSLQDLVDRDVVPVVRSKATVYNFLKKQKEGLLGEVTSRMKALSGEDIGSWAFFRKVAAGTHALVDTHSGAVGRAKRFERRGTRCRFHLARKPVKVDLDTIVYGRNSFINTQFNEIIKWFTYYGIVEKMKKPYYSIPCEANLRSDHPQAMTLQQTQGAFYVLAVGLLTASFILVVETIGSLCRKAVADTGRRSLTPTVVRHHLTPVVRHLAKRPSPKRAF
ncbi:glutamate receptor 3-like [Panulirus ornatus]|uniref:glutamate receptor 3-like n=1 Tax=Panulirus ornatus TaxID=150431 RepID=UPI003A88BFF6